jgi:hypothetical protein
MEHLVTAPTEEDVKVLSNGSVYSYTEGKIIRGARMSSEEARELALKRHGIEEAIDAAFLRKLSIKGSHARATYLVSKAIDLLENGNTSARERLGVLQWLWKVCITTTGEEEEPTTSVSIINVVADMTDDQKLELAQGLTQRLIDMGAKNNGHK